LHELTQASVGPRALDFFVLYSAAGAKLGAAGQGLYAAANAELDALAHRRHGAGLPALSVGWGMWDGVGMASGRDGARNAWRARGLLPITADTGFAQLRALLESGVPHGVVLPIDRERFFAQPHAGVARGYLAALHATPGDAAAAEAAAPEPTTSLQRLHALPAAQRASALHDLLVRQTLAVLGLPAGTLLDSRVPLKDLGLDSLMAVELRNALARACGQALPVTLLFDHPTLAALGQHLAQRFSLVTQAPLARPATEPLPHSHADVVALSEADAEALLLAELNGGRTAAPTR
jgi:acyl carrier protein